MINIMTCPACGGKIETPEVGDLYLCLYCGNRLQVTRQAGEVSADLLTQAVKAMQTSMDKTASEMAIKRLQTELDKLLSQRQPNLTEWQRLNAIHDKSPNYKLRTKVFLWTIPGSIILFFVGLASDAMWLGLTAVLIFFGAIIALIINGVNSVRKKKVEADFQKMAQFMIPLDEKIEKLRQELDSYRRSVKNHSDDDHLYLRAPKSVNSNEPVYKHSTGFCTITVYSNRIFIEDKRGGVGSLVSPKRTDIMLKNITGINISGVMRTLEVKMNDGTSRKIPNLYGKEAEKVREVIISLIK